MQDAKDRDGSAGDRELGNGLVTAVIAPRISRVMDFRRAGGENVFWTSETSEVMGWRNWGGDRAWWWPQDRWGEAWGEPGVYVPTPAIDGRPWRVVDGPGDMAIRSDVDEDLGAYLQRSFTLVEGEAAMRSTTTLVPMPGVGLADGEGRLPRQFVPWAITQMDGDGPVYARLIDGLSGDQAWTKPMGEKAMPMSRVDDRWVAIERVRESWFKVGLEADTLAVRLGDGWWFVQRYLGSATGGEFEPAERAQVYQDESLFELEFIAPSTGGSGPRSLDVESRLLEHSPLTID
ncbi:MAG: hypothetical protein AAGK09_01300 [Planctomycetota bacterium]